MAFQTMEALEWLVATVKSENNPDELSKKLYNPLGNCTIALLDY